MVSGKAEPSANHPALDVKEDWEIMRTRHNHESPELAKCGIPAQVYSSAIKLRELCMYAPIGNSPNWEMSILEFPGGRSGDLRRCSK